MIARFYRRRVLAPILLTTILAAPSALLAEGPESSTKANVDFKANGVEDYIHERLTKQHIPGASIAVVMDGKPVLLKGYGLANVELGVPATAATVYQLASITKTFTATAVMMLVEDGKIKVEDKVSTYLKDLPSAWSNVTVRQLLNHTSGIKSYTNVRDFFKTARVDYTRREILDLVAKDPLEFPSGEKFHYSNSGYFLLGLLIEKVAAKPYAEFLDQRIFKPLGMTQTRVNDLQAIIPHRAQGYTWDKDTVRNGEYVSPTQPYAAGALVSSVADLIIWDAALRTEALLKKSTFEMMWTATPLSKGGSSDYGFGWETGKVNDHRFVAHGGGIPGFSTQIMRFVDDKFTVIVLTNSDHGDPGALANGIAGRVLPVLAKKPETPIADPDPTTTDRLKRVVEGFLKGEVNPDDFSEEARKTLVPLIKEDKAGLAPFGPLKSFILLARKTRDEGTSLRYRTILEKATLTLTVGVDKNQKISTLGIHLEE